VDHKFRGIILKSKRYLFILLVLLSATFLTVIPVNSGSKSYVEHYKRNYSRRFKIKFISVEPHPDGSKYTFEVKSGTGRYQIKNWALYSSSLRYYTKIDSSEHAVQIKRWGKLYFPRRYGRCESRTVSFVLKHDPYHVPHIRWMRYRVRGKYTWYWGCLRIGS